MDDAGKAPTYISAGVMDITASVSVVYEIK
jgi:hypothetical protein